MPPVNSPLSWIPDRWRITRPGLILLYHRVAKPPSDPWQLAVSPDHFMEQMEVLANQYLPVPVREFGKKPWWGKMGRVAVSFDDGYRDNFLVARPILMQLGIPATFFIASGAMVKRREFWWDELYRLVMEAAKLPETIHLRAGDREFYRSTFPPEQVTRGPERDNKTSGKLPASSNNTLYLGLWQFLQPLEEGIRQQLLEELSGLTGVNRNPREQYLTMTSGELGALAGEPLFDIGAHTVNHPVMGILPPHDQESEIRHNMYFLESVTGKRIRGMAFPYGNYTPETLRIARRCGLSWACTTESKPVDFASQGFTLPRIQVHDWSGPEFFERLEQLFKRRF